MKKLPKIYHEQLDKDFCNNKKNCYCEKVRKLEPIENVIDEVFSGLGYSYNILLEIKTKEKDYITSLVAKTKTNLITIDNEVIPISEVISIKRKKN